MDFESGDSLDKTFANAFSPLRGARGDIIKKRSARPRVSCSGLSPAILRPKGADFLIRRQLAAGNLGVGFV